MRVKVPDYRWQASPYRDPDGSMAPHPSRRRASAIVSLLALTAACAAAGSPRGEPGPALAVMSFNLRYATANDGPDAWPARREMLFDLVRKHGPDILGTQEALRGQLDELGRAIPGYTEVGVGRDDGREAGEYAAILVRSARLDVIDQGTFWFSDTPAIPGSMTWGNRVTRICTWVRLRDRTSGRTFFVYNLHLDHESQPSRERSTRLLAERIAGRTPADPFIVTGDFNSGEDNAALRSLTAEAAGAGRLVDSYRRLHPRDSVVGTYHAFRGTATGEKIDHILLSPGWEVTDASIDRTSRAGRYPSDHFPVTALVRLVTPR